jgi:hypothetical protein
MAVLMGTASGSDYSFLASHDFFVHFNKPSTGYRTRLIQLAKESFEDLKRVSKTSPLPFDVALALEYIDLPASNVFSDLIADLSAKVGLPNPNDPYWSDFFAGPIARFIVDNEWDEIII